MHLDVQDLRNFYYRSSMGRAAQGVIRQQLRAFWPDVTGQTVVGFGFAVPLLRPYLDEARRVIGLMPGPQGVMPWPAGQPNVSVLCEETLWPLATGMADRLVLMHGLENSEHPTALLAETLRVLGPGGRAVFIVPNRAGLWSRSDRTPFGFGRPYTPGQLESQLKRHGFAIERSMSTLYQPPSNRRVWRRFAALLEAGGRHLPVFKAGGVVIVEASKQVLAPTRPGLPEAVRRRIPVLVPATPQPATRDHPPSRRKASGTHPAPTWNLVIAFNRDVLPVFGVGGYLIALVTGQTTRGGFALSGWSARLLVGLIARYFRCMARLGGTVFKRLLRIPHQGLRPGRATRPHGAGLAAQDGIQSHTGPGHRNAFETPLQTSRNRVATLKSLC